MFLSLALLLWVGLILAALFDRVHLPRLLGLLLTGIVLGPQVLGLLDKGVLDLSSFLRQMALLIILIKAGLTMDVDDLKAVGRPAVLLSFLPASCEMMGYFIFAPILLNISHTEAALMGGVLAAVSPAVVVPRMVDMIENNIRTEKKIPQMIMAGASCDDIYVLVMFSAFLHLARGEHMTWFTFLDIPISVLTALLFGIITGLILVCIFEWRYLRERYIRNSIKVILIMSSAFLLMGIDPIIQKKVAYSSVLAVLVMALVLNKKAPQKVSRRLSEKFGKIWLVAEVFLFVLVGATVDIRYWHHAGWKALILVLVALIFRAVGVLTALARTDIGWADRFFCVVAYLPKATVQAAIGSVPLAMGLPCGALILSVAVIGIVVTAPLGAIGIDRLNQKYIKTED